MLDLHIVTPCIRVGNLGKIAESIRAAHVPDGMKLHWLVVLDNRFGLDVEKARNAVSAVPGAEVELARSEGPGEYAQCNRALELISSGWIVFLDDDNLFHDALPARLAEAIRRHPDAGAIVYDQKLGDRVRRAAPRNVRVSRVDSGQFAVSRAFVADDRFSVYAPSADGAFIEALYGRAPEQFVFLSETLAYYNALTPGRFGEGSLERLTAGPRPAVQTAGSLYFHRSSVSDGATVKISSRGDRLYMSGDSPVSLRSPIPAGAQRLTGRAWLETSNRSGGRLTIRVAGDVLADLDMRPPPLMRRLLRRTLNFERDFVAADNAEIEITFEGDRAGVVLDALVIAQNE
ncbi:MAG TPA: glycosyltransferase family A protein [Thermoanaerobaculia bacterium]|jgi:hypothetical protein